MAHIDHTASSGRRGRPRAFDRDEALRRAMEAFWTYGYEGASMHRLVAATGIASASIYAAFGDKLGLFREAVGLYSATVGDAGRHALREIPDLKTALATMLDDTIDVLTSSAVARGCLITLGASALGPVDDPVRAFLKSERDRTRQCLIDRFAATDKRDGAMGDAEAMSGCVMAFLSGLSIEIADGTSPAKLRRSATLFVGQMLPA